MTCGPRAVQKGVIRTEDCKSRLERFARSERRSNTRTHFFRDPCRVAWPVGDVPPSRRRALHRATPLEALLLVLRFGNLLPSKGDCHVVQLPGSCVWVSAWAQPE